MTNPLRTPRSTSRAPAGASLSRCDLLRLSGQVLGSLAPASLLADDGLLADEPSDADGRLPTDDVGYKSVVDCVSVADLHATILHQLGLDHRRLSYRHHGRDETVTDAAVSGTRVVAELLARPAAVL
ncbi:MAG TPA: DUF1501 domain-containing protein [Pirellulales bacterium]|jgi:hypothetical protein|nr:DUF1501 domain-containing protein [Pirellulales bacterium]